MRIFKRGVSKEINFENLRIQDDKSLLYDIVVKLERCSDILCSLGKALSRNDEFIVSKGEWLFDFIVFCGCDINSVNLIVLDREDILLLLGFISQYKDYLISKYSAND